MPKSILERAPISQGSQALFEEEERAQATLESIGDAVISTDILGNIAYLNSVAERLTGWSREEAIGEPLERAFRIIDASTRAVAQNPMALAIRTNRTVALTPNCVLVRRDGVEFAIEDSAAPIHDRHGRVTGAVMVFRDASATRALSQKLSHLAQHDSLTDLPNRIMLKDRLTQAMALARRHKQKLAMLFLDVDGFKLINDSLGHAVGDGLLQSVAKRLQACVRGSDTVGRQGGDEFVILLSELANSQDAAITADKIRAALQETHRVGAHELHVTASIGIVTYPDDGTKADALMKNADSAMYHAKHAGRDNYQFFRPTMNMRAIERRALASGLVRAMERRELLLYYQPRIHLRSGSIVGVEALLRWRHLRRGLVPPAQFLPIAEERGLVVPIGQWVLREACRQAQIWQRAGLPLMRLAVNVSAAELRASGFVAGVRTTLADTGFDPRYLELELTEAFLTGNSTPAAGILEALRELGVRLTLDDFGTGHSSLSHLKRFHIDTLKIDRSFVRNLASHADDARIVCAVIGMGKNLDMQVVAEGIETQQQFAFLKEHGCPEGQGHYFSRPLAAGAFTRLLAEQGKLEARESPERDMNSREIARICTLPNINGTMPRADGQDVVTASESAGSRNPAGALEKTSARSSYPQPEPFAGSVACR